MYARVSKVMAQFVLKIEKLSHIMGPTPILEMARAYGLRPRLWLLVYGDEEMKREKKRSRSGRFRVTPGAIIRDGDRKRAPFLLLGLAP